MNPRPGIPNYNCIWNKKIKNKKKCGFRIGSLDLNELFYSQILIGTELEVLTILTLIAILKNLFPRDLRPRNTR